ncbi:MAG TPA: hypothetical protein VGJ16_11845, partial [Pirellulales bacterium]
MVIDELHLIIKYKDSSNYYYARLTVGASGTLAIHKVVAGVNTELASTPMATSVGTHYTVTICYGGGAIVASESVTGTTTSWSGTTTVNDAQYAGLGVGALSDVSKFDDFSYSYGYDADTKPTCTACTPDPCAVCSDDFDRADNADISAGSGCGWTEASGTWDITSKKLVCSSAGVAVCTATTGSAEGIITVSATQDTSAKWVGLV